MNDETAQILASRLFMTPDEARAENRGALDGETLMCPNCAERTDDTINEMIAILSDPEISKGIKFGYAIGASAAALAGSSHGQLKESEIYATLHGAAVMKESVAQADRIMEMIFGRRNQAENN